MAKYIKKPYAITATKMNVPFIIQTLEGVLQGKAGDYLVTGVMGEQYPVDREIFELTYDEVEDDYVYNEVEK